MKKKFKLGIVGIFIVFISFGFGRPSESNFEIVKNLDIFYTLFRELNRYYVDEIDPGKVMKSAIDAMLKSLDPYTNYIPEAEIEDFRFITTGQYGGVGAFVQTRADKVIIEEPYPDSPIDRAGLIAGDEILEIDDNSVKGKTSDEISKALKGQPSTKVKLKIKRYNQDKPFVKEIVREKIQVSSVPYYGMLEDKIAYIKLTNFHSKSAKEVKSAFLDLKTKHQLDGVILDLRDNPGGLLIQAVHIVNIFVPQGKEIVYTKGKIKEGNNRFYTLSTPLDTLIPLAVLVNRMSASAAEIVSGAIQDLDRGIVIGQRTFGKGLVQTTKSLSYNSQLKITTAKYHIPSGRCIQALDYSHRNPDGSVGKIPDSLISEFKTANGRKVFDGGGISPDIKVPENNYSEVTKALRRNNIIFDFVTDFYFKHDSIASAKDFKISEADFVDFGNFAEKMNFSYKTKSQKKLDDLKNVAKSEKYYRQMSEEFKKLDKLLAHNIKRDFELNKDEISLLLNSEIAARYYFGKGRIESELSQNKYVECAIKNLVDTAKYNEILNIK